MEGITVEKNKSYYQTLFQEYPDVVTQEQLRMMLNGVSISFTSKLIHEKRVKSFFIKPAYYIFKDSVIEYVQSEDYQNNTAIASVLFIIAWDAV